MAFSELISIIVPVYNAASKLNNSIESIINQDYNNFEVIMVDDGSTDDSAFLIKEYIKNDNRIKYIYKSNGGVSSARNLGIKYSKGEWVLFIDADDKLAPNALSVFLKYIRLNRNVKIFISNYFISDINYNLCTACKISKSKIIINPIKCICLENLYSRPGNTIIHKSVFKVMNGYDESLTYCEDYEFSLRLLSIYRCFYISIPLLTYYANNGASMRIHDLNNDFVSHISNRSRTSIWMSHLLFRSLIYGVKRRIGHKDYELCKQILMKNMNFVDKCVYVILATYIRIYKLFKLKNESYR